MGGAIEIDAIPARWEESLCSHSETGLGWKAIGSSPAILKQAYVLYGKLMDV